MGCTARFETGRGDVMVFGSTDFLFSFFQGGFGVENN